MAAGTTVGSPDLLVSARPVKAAREVSALALVMKALSSLKLAVGLFAYGIFVVLVGTLAQTEMDIWQVVPLYFRSVVMWVDVNLFFPEAFFHGSVPRLPIPPIPMPGGMVVGVLMLVNLTAAHLWRFQMHARGMRLVAGMAALLLAVLATIGIIVSGNLGTGIQAEPLLPPLAIWVLFLGLVGAAWLTTTYYFVRFALQEWAGMVRDQAMFWFGMRLLLLFGGGFVAFTVLYWSMVLGYLAPPTESMRILWQLLQGTLAGVLLLGACYVLFAKRAGVVLLHGGVALMMFSELIVARYAVEWQMSLAEGEAANYARDIRTTELAIIAPPASESEGESVVVIPRDILLANEKVNQRLDRQDKPPVPIRDVKGADHLPLDIAVLKYYRNHELRELKEGEKPRATAGIGLKLVAEEARASTGTDSSSEVDVGALYVKLTDKATNKDLGTYLLSQLAEPGIGRRPEEFITQIDAGGKPYQLLLRFERQYKPYTVKLVDVRKDDYLGSDTPKNYSSDVVLVDPETGVDSKIHIKMNDPLRYRGDTFYQSGYAPAAPRAGQFKETTTLAVVNNVGWMIPYVACMIVVTGMVFQFSIALQRFLNRRSQEETKGAVLVPPGSKSPVVQQPRKVIQAELVGQPPRSYHMELLAVAIAAVIALGYIGSKLREKEVVSKGMSVTEFGKLPVVQEGRVKPIDTLARNALRALSSYETVRFGKDGEKIKLPATQWLLDTVTRQKGALDYRVFKVDHPELIKLLELSPQPRNLYSLKQLFPKTEDLRHMAIEAMKKQKNAPNSLNNLDRKALELEERLRLYQAILVAFNPPQMPRIPTPEEQENDPAMAQRMADDFRLWIAQFPQQMKQMGLPLLVPRKTEGKAAEDEWLPYPTAWLEAMVTRASQQEPQPAADQIGAILTAYEEVKPAEFNKALAEYHAELDKLQPQGYSERKVDLEAYFNYVSPFYLGAALYVMALVVALGGWLFQSRPANLAAMTIIGVTLLLHTLALVGRIYISGRPPVTNLYSSAVFIGWGCVLLCLVFETVFLNGLGNVVGAMTGFAALVIAYFLAAGGDTISVLQAVLDTQFWLATHVVCITLGYTATYIAGFFGLCYVILGICTPKLTDTMRSELARMIYGVTCFAIVLSFFGTVLGGLWADDSWGRFWGWDPKENGALIIVMWNALVLHARWDKLVKDRGLAILAILGNVVTSWSWFGVNELGVGLHSYGFTEGVVRALGTFALYMLVCVGFGLLPLKYWLSGNRNRPMEEVAGPVGITFGAVNAVFLAAFCYFAYQYMA